MFRTNTIFLVALATCCIAPRALSGPIQLPNGQALEKVDFDRHVHALLDRQGCNAGKCHGNRDAKGGFALSLFAAAPAKDHAQIVHKGQGRYINAVDPDRSLILQKATGQLRHEGATRVAPNSWEYQVLRQWIADGALRGADGQVTALEIVPREHVFKVGDSLQLKVLAQFSDGGKEDVTPFCDFRLADDGIVRLSRTGKIDADKPGDAGISVVYRGRLRVMRALVAYPAAKGFVYPTVPEVNFIDRTVFAKLRRLNVVPSDLCSDEHFLRRVHIDVVGVPPTPAEVRAFLANKDADKRTKKIDELLAHPMHAAVVATRFCEMTDLVGGTFDKAVNPRAKAAQMSHDWFRQRVRDNVPYDRIVAGVLTATSREGRSAEMWQEEKAALAQTETGFGTSYFKRATLDHYWRHTAGSTSIIHVFGDTVRSTETANHIYYENLAERTAVAFLGINLECARCHLHPTEGWSPADYRAFANVFGQVRLDDPWMQKTTTSREQAAVAREISLGAPTHQQTHPDTDLPLKPRLLGGPEIRFDGDARQALADWLARPDNPFFARHFVNSTWQHYFGIRLENAELRDLLAKDFIDHKFDIRRLERTILLSRVYQLTIAPNDTNKHDRTNFARTIPRRLGPRTTSDMLHAALDVTDDFGSGVPAGLRAVEVMHDGETVSLVSSENYRDQIGAILHRFARFDLMSRCSTEESILAYANYLHTSRIESLLARSPRVQRLIKTASLDEIIDETFLATLSRLPSAEHRKTATEYLQREKRKVAVENLFWALVNTTEFTRRY